MPDERVTGWDLGGAHLKMAQVDRHGRVERVVQLPCPLWQGLSELDSAVAAVGDRLEASTRFAVTMTGELADLFESRADGVRSLTDYMVGAFPETDIAVYAGRAGFLPPAQARDRPRDVASTNWLAGACLVASRREQGLFIDIGSTTTDILPFRDGAVLAEGYSDEERLVADELLYTGVTRTPIMAVARMVPFAGVRQHLMAELFSSMADAYRLTGELPADADQVPAMDGGAKDESASARRLARMLGRDLEQAPMAAWRQLAAYLGERQLRSLHDSCERVLSRGVIDTQAPVMGAGAGRFLARRLADRLNRPYEDFGALVGAAPEASEWAARCVPAVAVAILACQAP